MKWTKNGCALLDGGSLDLHQSAEVCVLHITNVKRTDAAEYEMQLSNDSGTETVPITVKVIGKLNCQVKVKLYLSQQFAIKLQLQQISLAYTQSVP